MSRESNDQYIIQIKLTSQVIREETIMIELIIGIIIGATFHEFWSGVYKYVKRKISEWNSKQEASSE